VSAWVVIAVLLAGMAAGWLACSVFTISGHSKEADEDDALDQELEALDPRRPWRDEP